MNPEEFVKIAAPALQALAILVTAIFASLGLNAWRRQLVGKRRFEVAEEVLLTAHEAKLSLAYVRNPAGFVNEGTKEGEATLGRMQKISGDLAELKKTLTIAEIHIGPKAFEGITAILDAFHEVSWAANMLLMQAGRVLAEDKSKQKQVFDKLEAWWLTIYDGPNDDLTKRADEAISQLSECVALS